MLVTRSTVRREPCRRCQILRVMLLMLLGVILVALLAKDSLSHLGGIQPIMFGYFFVGLAFITLIAKSLAYFLERKRKS